MTSATETKIDLKPAARRLVGGFSMIPLGWLKIIADELEPDEGVCLPAHGTCFKVDDSCDRRTIEKLLLPWIPTDLEDLAYFAGTICSDIEFSDYKVDHHPLEKLGDASNVRSQLEPAYDVEKLREDIKWEWCRIHDEECQLDDDGWQKVGKTGLIAREFDGHLILAINGGGYDFYDAHWIPLYRELGYSWHEGA